MPLLLTRLAVITALLLAFAPCTFADDYPNRPVRLIIPFPPGGSNDVVGRLVAQQLTAKLGQQVYVDNRGGAGGTIGTEASATAAPDGYTICVISIATRLTRALHAQI
jgi:tripartite-type tricarboxylate transporter receptor subunit TctC